MKDLRTEAWMDFPSAFGPRFALLRYVDFRPSYRGLHLRLDTTTPHFLQVKRQSET
jgi:hypothetical protein